MSGLAVVFFGLVIIVFGSSTQQRFVLPVFGLGAMFVGWGMEIKVNAGSIIQHLLGFRGAQ